MTLSLLYSANPFSFKVKDTKATCEGSIAYRDIAVGPASMFTLLTKSLIDSTIFLRISA